VVEHRVHHDRATLGVRAHRVPHRYWSERTRIPDNGTVTAPEGSV
jgi:hypothetical protein